VSTSEYTLGALLEELSQETVHEALTEKPLPAALAPAADSEGSPWYVKAMVGVAAWIAAILLGFFFSLLGIIDTSEQLIGWGVGLLVGAVALKWWQRESIFWGQLAFAVVLAGQGLLLAGVGVLSEDATTVALAAIALEVALLLLYPDALHRMVSLLAIVGAATFLLYEQEWPQLIHALIFIVAAGAVATWQAEFRLLTSRLRAYRAPLGYGFALALFALCSLALTGWYGEIQWWITTAALTVVLLYLGYQVLRELALPLSSRAARWALFAILLLVIPAYETPGILAAVIVLLLGRWRSNGLLLGIATAFLLFFLSAYYYNLEITLLTKSYILMGTGLALLAAWWGLRRTEEQKTW